MTGRLADPLRRRILLGTAAGLAGLAGRPASAAASAAKPLQIVGPWEIGGLAPANSGYIFARMQVAETLMDANDDGSPAPALAERWRLSPDGLLWRFELRPQARFHDGTPVDAAAVIRCLEAARTPPSVLSLAPIRSIEAAGPRAVSVRLASPYGGLPALLAHSSALVLAPSSFDAGGAVRRIVGSGPYRIVELRPPQSVEAVVFEHHDGPRPAIERIRYLAAGRAETRALMAQAQQSDLAYGLDPASVQRLRRQPDVQMVSRTIPRTIIVKVNAGHAVLKDRRVREALSLAVDRAGIARALMRDVEAAASQLLPPTLAGWHDPGLTALVHDRDRAAALLAEAGWRRDGDGVRDAAGRALRLTLRTFPDRPELPLIATALQAQWRAMGIAVRVAVGNSGDIPLGHRDGTLELGLAARNYANVADPIATLAVDFGAPAGGDWGAMGWSDPGVAEALAELARGGLDPERRTTLRRRVTTTLQAELPVLPIAWYRQHVAASRRLAGVTLDPLERSYRITSMNWRT